MPKNHRPQPATAVLLASNGTQKVWQRLENHQVADDKLVFGDFILFVTILVMS